MKESILTSIIIAIFVCVLPAQGESFYRSALEEGLTDYHAGKYEQALERLRFAAFGMMDNPSGIRRVHVYSALTLFAMSRITEARAAMEALGPRPEALSASELGVEPGDEKMFRILKRTLFIGNVNRVSPGTRRAFELLFDDTLEAARSGKWKKGKSGLKKIADLLPGEPRVAMLRGMVYFAMEDFGAASRELESVYDTIQPEFRDELKFYLVRACERLGRYGRALQVLNEIEKSSQRDALAPVKNAILERRVRDITRLAEDFSRDRMHTLIKQFPADHGLAGEIWVQTLRKVSPDPNSRENLIFNLARFATATDRHFYIQAGEYLARIKREKQALRLLEKSLYAKDYSRENVPFMYTMGVILQKNGQKKKALESMQRILRVQPGYEPARIFMANAIQADKKNTMRRES